MSFSAIVPAVHAADANAALEAAGYGKNNFSVPLVQDGWKDGDPFAAYGMNVGGNAPEFREAVAAVPGVDIRDTEPGAVGFDQHLAALGLFHQPAVPVETEE